MSWIAIRDDCLWPKHIEGNAPLQARLLSLTEGEIIILKIGQTSGAFRKMAQGANLQPTPGLKPACDTTRAWWRKLYESAKGERLPIYEVTE